MIDALSASHKIQKASHVLTMWSPWWSRYLSKCDFSYVSDKTMRITGLSSMVIYADLGFVEDTSLMGIAIALEYALQQSIRDMDVRATRMLSEYSYVDESLVALAESLEINSDIHEKFSTISQSQWENIVSRSLDKSYVSSFDVKTKPSLPEDAFLPEMFGLEPGLTAEKYVRKLAEIEKQREQEWLDEEDKKNTPPEENPNVEDTPNDDGDSRDTPDYETPATQTTGSSSSGDNTGDGSTDSQSSDDILDEWDNEKQSQSNDNSDVSVNPDDDTQGEPTSGTQENDTQPDTGDEESSGVNTLGSEENPSESESGGNSGEHEQIQPQVQDMLNQLDADNASGDDSPQEETSEQQNNSQQESQQENTSENGDSPNDDNNIDPRNQDTGSTDGDDNVTRDAGEDTQESTLDELDDLPEDQEFDNPENLPLGKDHYSPYTQNGGDYTPLTESLRMNSGDMGAHCLNTPQLPQGDTIRGVDYEDREEIKKELAEDIAEHVLSIPTTGGYGAGDHFDEWAKKKLHKPKANWKKILPKMLTSIVARAEMSGVSDMSYSKLNPNQQPGMPIMMGFITYPPEVTILIDASPSMVNEKQKTMSEFMGLMQKFLMRYSQPITVVLADSGIKSVVSSIAPTRDVLRAVSRTYHGTSQSFGSTLMRIAKKGAKHKSRNYPKPAILVVLTDCLFQWEMMNVGKLPYSYATIIIVSTREYSEVEEFLPAWVKKNENFVYIND